MFRTAPAHASASHLALGSRLFMVGIAATARRQRSSALTLQAGDMPPCQRLIMLQIRTDHRAKAVSANSP